MGIVYLARDRRGRDVAIKTLQFGRTVDERDEIRFQNEIRILHRIDHVNVVRFYKAGRLERDTSVLWVALEYLAGPSLSDLIAGHRGQLDPEDVMRWTKQIAEGLAAAHARGVIHRDLKPANIKFDGNTVKVIDFGIASARDIGGLTMQGASVGTLGYMAPEQLEPMMTCDARADIFALGVILFELAAGRHPLVRNGEPPTTGELIARLLTTDAPRLGEVAPHIPPALSDIAARALQRERDDRYASITEMRDALDAAMRAYRDTHRPLVLGARALAPLSSDPAAKTLALEEWDGPSVRVASTDSQPVTTMALPQIDMAHIQSQSAAGSRPTALNHAMPVQRGLPKKQGALIVGAALGVAMALVAAALVRSARDEPDVAYPALAEVVDAVRIEPAGDPPEEPPAQEPPAEDPPVTTTPSASPPAPPPPPRAQPKPRHTVPFGKKPKF